MRILLFLLLALSAAAQPNTPGRGFNSLLNNLAFHYSLDAQSVYVDDLGTNDLTNVGSTTGGASILGKAPSFNGSTKALTGATNLSLHVSNVSFTVAYWCYTTVSNQAFAGTVGKNTDGSPYSRDEWRTDYVNGQHRFSIGNGTGSRSQCDSTNRQFANLWALVIAVRSNNNHLYIHVNNGNGANDTENGGFNTNTVSILANNPGCCSLLEIGRHRGASYFNGMIDDVSFWTNRVLTRYEMSMIWNAGHGGVSRWIASKKNGQP